MMKPRPIVGDYVISWGPRGFVIERVTPGGDPDHISTEESRTVALKMAKSLAEAANTNAWTYELDNTYSQL